MTSPSRYVENGYLEDDVPLLAMAWGSVLVFRGVTHVQIICIKQWYRMIMY